MGDDRESSQGSEALLALLRLAGSGCTFVPWGQTMPTVREPFLEPVAIANLRPTQLTVGMREVKAKRKRWREIGAKKKRSSSKVGMT